MQNSSKKGFSLMASFIQGIILLGAGVCWGLWSVDGVDRSTGLLGKLSPGCQFFSTPSQETFSSSSQEAIAPIGFAAVSASLSQSETPAAPQQKKSPQSPETILHPQEKGVYTQPGPFQVESFREDWHDSARNRTIPVKIYHPIQDGRSAPGPFPVILFSHGLGGSREGYEYLGRHWASYGYVCVHLQHPGSDESVWRGKAQPIKSLQEAVRNPLLAVNGAVNRTADVRFALDWLETLQKKPGSLKGRLDLGRIGMAGHSFGASTTLALAGQVAVLPTGREISGADSRIKAAVVMSPPVPKRPTQRQKAYQKITIPCFYMTGTEDDSPIGETRKEDRRVPFDLSGSAADRYLVTFTGGDHGIFAGRSALTPRRQREKDAIFHKLICAASTAFWDAYLREDSKAKEWLLSEDGFQRLLGPDGTFEKKSAQPNLLPEQNATEPGNHGTFKKKSATQPES